MTGGESVADDNSESDDNIIHFEDDPLTDYKQMQSYIKKLIGLELEVLASEKENQLGNDKNDD